MTQKPRAIVLGGTNPHISLIENLKERGYYTVLIDYYENPPAKEAADEHLRESTLNKDKVTEIAKTMNAKLVISTCIDQANATACYVAEQLNLPMPYTYETALNVTNKGFMKQLMISNDIPTSKYILVNNFKDFEESGIQMPVVVKPADSNGSVGVKKANNIDELRSNLEEAINISRTNQAIIEEFVDGIELSIDCFVKNRETHVILIRQKLELIKEKGQVLQSPGSFSPAKISEAAFNKIQNIACRIPEVFKFDNTPLLIQAFVKNDEVSIIEFAPRIGGGLSFRTIQMNTGFDILNTTVDYYLGENTDIIFNPPQHIIATIIVNAFPGILDKVDGYTELLQEGIIEEFHHYKTKGMIIGSDMSTRSRVGAFIVKAENKTELNKKINQAINKLQVYDINGQDIMRKNIFKSLDINNSLVL